MTDTPDQTLLGVITPNGTSPLEQAVDAVTGGLEVVRDRLTALRTQRGEINDQIRDLVQAEELLERMVRASTARRTAVSTIDDA